MHQPAFEPAADDLLGQARSVKKLVYVQARFNAQFAAQKGEVFRADVARRAAMRNALSDDRAKAASELGISSSRSSVKDAAVGGAGPGNHGNISSGSHASGALKRPSTLRTVKTRGIGSVER